MDNSQSCSYSTKLLNKLKALDSSRVLDFTLINKAICWAKKYHGEQKRKSGELFYTHPLEVAYMLADYNLKTEIIVASILHDIVEDTEVTVGMIVDHFSWRIAEMVDRLTRDRPDGTKLEVESILNNAYQSKDEEILLIKLFDRLHNLYTLDSLVLKKQSDIKLETINLFPLVCILLDSMNFGELLIQNLSSDKNSSTSFIDRFYQKSGADCLTSSKFIEIIKG
ncbi:MAG: bifunctional (p)ppGpp synthetase/guanosine-3',5'-bis(diphosphate) 3'-pyrophosphohydrolase [Rickettsiales bacterium]|nr:MAG: bifunctional (p)ppGpp synthetase/guanosine-3',5'-bis(diphosphate) 3'-pyrophosphohydrolase [Rickettsiales bacterium]